MSDTFGNPAAAAAGATHQEAYSFACLNCGHGWEQSYAIEHRADLEGRMYTVYWANGVRVSSPLTRPSCPGCGDSHVRIMRAGRVASVSNWWHWAPEASVGTSGSAASRHGRTGTPTVPSPPAETALPMDGATRHPATRQRRPWRLHVPFHFRLRGRHSTPEA
jgi:predicted RNA-binding Zn-ribbon protein involved in translation (DUF1610 family)